jgi:phosphoglycerate dehydrogenase-like enzyme
MMKKTAYLINTSRGPVVNEVALCKALEMKIIAGAALDVFMNEPLPKNSPLIDMGNVVLTPHMGTNTLETRRAMVFNVIDNVKIALQGKKPPNVVPEQSEMLFG